MLRAIRNIKAGDNSKTETVIPSLMVAADYTSGIFIYGDRIYYATPNNVGNTAGTVDNTYLDFKSVSLDGSDVRDYFRISDNAALYRFVQTDNTVYVVYEMNDTLTSYNTETGTSVDLARSRRLSREEFVGYATTADVERLDLLELQAPRPADRRSVGVRGDAANGDLG